MGLKSVNDVARMFNYERSTIIRYICDGKLEAIGGGAKGKPYYISDEAIEKFREMLESIPEDQRNRKRPRRKKTDKVREPHPIYDIAGIMKKIIKHNGVSALDVLKKMGDGGYAYKYGVLNGQHAVSREFSKAFCKFFDIESNDLDTLIASQQYMDVEIRKEYEDIFPIVSSLGPSNHEDTNEAMAPEETSEAYYISVNAKKTGDLEYMVDCILTPLKAFNNIGKAFEFINQCRDELIWKIFKLGNDEPITSRLLARTDTSIEWAYISSTDLMVYDIEFVVKKMELV